MTPGTLEDKVALVTGATGSLGRATVDALGAAGAVVVGVDVKGPCALHEDLGTAEGNERAVQAVIADQGKLDILVLTAGIQHLAPIGEFEDLDWERVMAVTLTGPFQAIRSAWPYLTRHPGGRIVATASTGSFIGERFKAAYIAAKHGLVGLVKVAALEGAPDKLTANAVAPSWMRTPLVEGQVEEQARLRGIEAEAVIADFVDDHAEKRFVEPVEVAETIAFLASPQASGINGTCVRVDLGALA